MKIWSMIAALTLSTACFAQNIESYESNLKLFDKKKVGFGIQSGGDTGAIGIRLALNIEDQDGVMAGFGYGTGYQTFTMAWKHHFEGEYFTPYTHLGWSRWHNSSYVSNLSSYVLNAELSPMDRQTGHFGVDFVMATAGLGYQELGGDLLGFSFNMELGVLQSIQSGRLFPAASVGTGIYF